MRRPGPAEPVGIGDVGEERRPDQVDADADHAGPRAAIAAPGRVPALVEGGGEHGQAEHNEQIHRVAQDLLKSTPQAMRGEQPAVHGRDGAGHGHDHRPPEQRPEQRPGGVRRAFRQQRAARPEREQRVGPGQVGRDALGGNDAEGQQLGRDEQADLAGVQCAAQVGAGQLRDGGKVAGAVDPRRHPVQQWRHLDDLAVGPPHERRRLAVAGVLVLAEQLDSAGQPGRLSGPGLARRGRGRCRTPASHGPCGHGHGPAPP